MGYLCRAVACCRRFDFYFLFFGGRLSLPKWTALSISVGERLGAPERIKGWKRTLFSESSWACRTFGWTVFIQKQESCCECNSARRDLLRFISNLFVNSNIYSLRNEIPTLCVALRVRLRLRSAQDDSQKSLHKREEQAPPLPLLKWVSLNSGRGAPWCSRADKRLNANFI